MSFRLLLFPFAILYGVIVWLRNKLFDWNVLSSTQFNFPVVSVGNLSAGGTGKTPHVEYLISILKDKFKVAVLSRGYKRETTNFIIATDNSTINDIGDEPKQIKLKYPEALVAVDNKRVNGINNILDIDKSIEAIILDDAYQHRWVRAGVSILLIDYNKPIFNDYMLPAGNLRECRTETKRADIIIITKCPESINQAIRNNFQKRLKLKPNQLLFFTKIAYGSLKPVFNNNLNINPDKYLEYSVLLITGIANPKPLINYISGKFKSITHIQFSDHHNYTDDDLKKIISKYKEIKNNNAIIITTEKDSVRFHKFKNNDDICGHQIYYIPIEIKFQDSDEITFINKIVDYVRTNKRNN